MAQSQAKEWRELDKENALVIELESGLVIAELANDITPGHAENTKTLTREKLFDNTQFYRVIDGFVAQGGPSSLPEGFQPANGQLSIAPEFSTKTKQAFPITELNQHDGYAERVGFYKGFTVGQSKDQKETWLLHCHGALGMGRANEPNSGGTELYVVIGHSQRYLDKNVTVFGRVVYGMEHLQALKRTTSLSGPVDIKDENKILSIQIASDLPADKLPALEFLKTNSPSFKQFIQARKTRQEDWFIDRKDYIDVCAIQVPARLKN